MLEEGQTNPTFLEILDHIESACYFPLPFKTKATTAMKATIAIPTPTQVKGTTGCSVGVVVVVVGVIVEVVVVVVAEGVGVVVVPGL